MSSLFTPLIDALALASFAEERPKKRAKIDEPMYSHVVMRCTPDVRAEKSMPDELRNGVLKAMFQAATEEEAVESNRRKIYKLWREEGGDDDE
jgi:ribosomal RNA-processing protein 1